MRLLRLTIAGFGALRGEYRFDPARLALVVDDNERGKSTLLAALAAALYGLENDRRSHRLLTPLERWKPWEGSRYGVELELEHAGERWVVARDFDRGTVSVWNGRGQEVTADFREGKDDYPVGRRLLGLDADEFEKCALIRQGELDAVVPADEKLRRASTLHARLENAADTRTGDTNATEALRVLEGALVQYNSEELGTTLKVDTAIQRLEAKRALLDSELAALDHARASIDAPLAELATLTEREHAARAGLEALDREKRLAMAGEVRRQIERDEQHKAEVAKLRAEAEALAGAAHLPANAEAEMRDTVARLEEAQRHIASLDQRRNEAQREDREALRLEAMQLAMYDGMTVDDADRCLTLASEIRRLAEDDERLRAEMFQFRDALAGRGVDPERIRRLQDRFGRLPEAQLRLLHDQSELALAFQTEVAGLEEQRTGATEVLREIDAHRHGRRVHGWMAIALGAAVLAGGVVAISLGAIVALAMGLVFGGTALLVAGIALLVLAARARGADRETALQGLAEAQRRLNQLRARRAETEVALAELSRTLGYRDPVELLRDWGEHLRISEEYAPALRAEDRLRALEARGRAVVEDATGLLARAGGGTPEPPRLEAMAAGIRERLGVDRRMAELERTWSRFDDERRIHEATASGLKERAIRVLQGAGLAYDPERSWADHLVELGQRLHGRQRHDLLVQELIPRAERALLPAAALARLEADLELIEAERTAGGSAADAIRPVPEIEAAIAARRAELDEAQRRMQQVRLDVDEIWRRVQAEHPAKAAERERVARALVRATRFRSAIELARETLHKVATDTHRRWADHLNERVGEILRAFGTRVEQLRFGDDLDFSVRLWNGQPIARGKAVLQLSAGARDQLHLAVRLAVSEYLSRGREPVPLLVDDAFASSDDGRAAAGMRLLIQLAERHQVVLVTCHRGRHEAFAAAEPELYGRAVQWLDARAASAANGS